MKGHRIPKLLPKNAKMMPAAFSYGDVFVITEEGSKVALPGAYRSVGEIHFRLVNDTATEAPITTADLFVGGVKEIKLQPYGSVDMRLLILPGGSKWSVVGDFVLGDVEPDNTKSNPVSSVEQSVPTPAPSAPKTGGRRGRPTKKS